MRGMSRVLAVAIALLSSAGPTHADDWDAYVARLKQEARQLFIVVRANEPTPQRCQFGKAWISDRPVPREIASSYLGLKLHADLAGEETGTRPADLLDPDKKHLDYFCDEETAKKDYDTRYDAFKAGSAPKLEIERTSYSFPVFDETYTTAIFVETDDPSHFVRRNGVVPRIPFEFFASAMIYRKVAGKWHFLKSELLAAT